MPIPTPGRGEVLIKVMANGVCHTDLHAADGDWAGSCFYVFTVAALGIALGTIASTMAQFGQLSIPVLLVMMLLSGSTTPLESMPVWLAHVMNVISPTPHFVVFAQDVLYRGADFPTVWTEILATFVIGTVYFGVALYRFRRVIFSG